MMFVRLHFDWNIDRFVFIWIKIWSYLWYLAVSITPLWLKWATELWLSLVMVEFVEFVYFWIQYLPAVFLQWASLNFDTQWPHRISAFLPCHYVIANLIGFIFLDTTKNSFFLLRKTYGDIYQYICCTVTIIVHAEHMALKTIECHYCYFLLTRICYVS